MVRRCFAASQSRNCLAAGLSDRCARVRRDRHFALDAQHLLHDRHGHGRIRNKSLRALRHRLVLVPRPRNRV
jgi:hypothetical protein